MNSPVPASRSERAERALTSLGVYLWEAWPAEGRLRIDAEVCSILGIVGDEDRHSVSALYLRAHVDDGPGLFEAFDAAARNGEGFTLRRRFTQADGSTRWWEVRGEIVSGESCEDRVVAGWMREVHEEHLRALRTRNLDPDLIDSHRLSTIECCADGVAHEFKNVLQIIRGYVSFAKKAIPGDSAPAADLEQALIATDRASDVAHQLLAIARDEDDDLSACDVNELLSDMARFLQPILGAEIEVSVAISVDPVEVTGLEASIRQILVNLCLNSRDAMPCGGRLLLRAERFTTLARRDDIGRGLEPGDYARIYVTDNGGGVAAENLERLFDPFYTTKNRTEGSGLGMTVVRQLVESGGGCVTAHSVEGVGTTITLFLPLQAPDTKPELEPLRDADGDLLVLGEGRERSVAALVDAGWHVHFPGPEHEHADADRAASKYRAVLVEGDSDAGQKATVRRLAGDSPVVSLTGFDPQSFHADRFRVDADAVVAYPIDTDRLAFTISELGRRSSDNDRAHGEAAAKPLVPDSFSNTTGFSEAVS